MSAQQALTSQGVTFPDGASASLRPGSSTLVVTNTASNQDIVQQIIDLQTQSVPSAVSVEVTMIRTETTTLNELGFDWLINPAKLGSDSLFAGAAPPATQAAAMVTISPTLAPPDTSRPSPRPIQASKSPKTLSPADFAPATRPSIRIPSTASSGISPDPARTPGSPLESFP